MNSSRSQPIKECSSLTQTLVTDISADIYELREFAKTFPISLHKLEAKFFDKRFIIIAAISLPGQMYEYNL